MFEITLSTLGAIGGVLIGWSLRQRAGLENEDLVKALEKLTEFIWSWLGSRSRRSSWFLARRDDEVVAGLLRGGATPAGAARAF